MAAGGRYDGLVQAFGGPAIPGVGFALGVERLVLVLRHERRAASGPAVYSPGLGAEARDWAVSRWRIGLRRKGVGVEIEAGARSLKSQMRRADKLKARAV